MARTKFLPDKSGTYIVEYGSGLDRKSERVIFDRGKWRGIREDEFYKKEVLSWYDPTNMRLGIKNENTICMDDGS